MFVKLSTIALSHRLWDFFLISRIMFYQYRLQNSLGNNIFKVFTLLLNSEYRAQLHINYFNSHKITISIQTVLKNAHGNWAFRNNCTQNRLYFPHKLYYYYSDMYHSAWLVWLTITLLVWGKAEVSSRIHAFFDHVTINQHTSPCAPLHNRGNKW